MATPILTSGPRGSGARFIAEPALPPDSTARVEAEAKADTAGSDHEGAAPTRNAHPGSRRGADSTRAISRFDGPRWVMLRSLVLPAWGQFHNHAWIKGAVIASAEVGLGIKVLDDKRNLDRLRDQVNSLPAGDEQDRLAADYNSRLNGYVTRQWLVAAVVSYALIDAYIDAHFRNFRIEFESDPALPRDLQGRGRARAALRWSF